MANDQSIELRVSLQERQMETVVQIMEEIRTNYLTRTEFREALAEDRAEFRALVAADRAEFRAALALQRGEFAQAMDAQKVEFRAAVDKQLSHYATKEDLAKTIQYSRNWVISVGLSLAALQFTMQMVFFQWYTHLR